MLGPKWVFLGQQLINDVQVTHRIQEEDQTFNVHWKYSDTREAQMAPVRVKELPVFNQK